MQCRKQTGGGIRERMSQTKTSTAESEKEGENILWKNVLKTTRNATHRKVWTRAKEKTLVNYMQMCEQSWRKNVGSWNQQQWRHRRIRFGGRRGCCTKWVRRSGSVFHAHLPLLHPHSTEEDERIMYIQHRDPETVPSSSSSYIWHFPSNDKSHHLIHISGGVIWQMACLKIKQAAGYMWDDMIHCTLLKTSLSQWPHTQSLSKLVLCSNLQETTFFWATAAVGS